jgi:hypothetical protein
MTILGLKTAISGNLIKLFQYLSLARPHSIAIQTIQIQTYMSTSNQPSDDKLYVRRALEASIHIGLVGLVLFWCFKIGQPFIQIIVWGIIIAVAIHPIYSRLKSALGGRARLAATLITLLALILLLVPTIMLSDSLIDTAREFSAQLDAGTLSVPPPSESVRSWPVIGEPVYKLWSLGSTDLGAVLSKMAPQLKKYGISLLGRDSDVRGFDHYRRCSACKCRRC